MNRQKNSRTRLLLILLGLLPVTWLGLYLAPYLGDGLAGLLTGLNAAMERPFSIQITDRTLESVTGCLGIYLLAVGIALSSRRNTRNGEEHGSAKWGDPQKVCRKYQGRPYENNLLFTRHVRLGLDSHRHRRNLNVLVVGGSGAGKTRSYCKPNLFQANTSYVILDPKGELTRDTGGLLEALGYEVRVLDLIHMEDSFCYNPFVYIENDNDAQRLVTNLFKATTPKNSTNSDPFWDTAAQMLLMALVLYLHHEAPPEEQNFAMVMELLSAGEVKEENDSFQSPLDVLFYQLSIRDPNHIAVKYYNNYRSGSGKTLKSIQITLMARLEKFNLHSLASLTITDELDLPSLGEKKVALFAQIPDNDSSFNFLVSILYTQLFQQLFSLADRKYNGALPVHVHFLMDEFSNVSLPDDFEKILSVMRSREVSCSIILQNLAQLKALFEKQWESVVGNCDSFLFLGGNEKETHKYVSELLGKETLDVSNHGKTKGRNGSYSTNYQQTARELLTPDEVRMLDNDYALFFLRGERPIKTINNHLELRDAINFYQLTELRDEGKPTGHVLNDGLRGKIKGALTSNLYATDQGFWNAFVDEARQSINAGKPIVFGMAYTSGGSKVGHSLVVCGFSEIDDYYVFETYDCNNIGDDKTGEYLYIVVHKNSYNFYLQYGRNPEEVLPQDGTASFITFYATNVPDNRNWFELSFWSADDIYNQIAKLGENIGLQKQIETDNVAKLSNNSQRSVITFDANSPVKIINSEGKSLSYNGVSLTGDMNVYDIQLVGNRELKLKVITDESGQFKVENPIDDKMYSIEMDGAYFSAGAIGADEIMFEGKNGIGIEGNQFRFDVSLSDGTTKTLSHVSGISSNDCSISCNEEYIELENDGEYSNVQIKNYGNDESEKRIDDSFKGKQIQKNPFVDVSSNSYYYDAVLWAVDNGITTGTSDTTFSPNASCTRAQAVTFLWRAAGEPEPEGTGTKFSDVPSGQYYSKAVQWAVEQGITSGTGNGEFSPNTTCSRAQIVTFLWRLEGKPTVSGGNNFADVSDGAYYVDAVTWAVQNGITTGTSSTMFTPAADCSRAQIVTFLYRDLA